MIPNYRGFTCSYDRQTNTYSRRPVKVRFPCSKCGSSRPENVIVDENGGVKIEIGQCCPIQKLDKVVSPGNK